MLETLLLAVVIGVVCGVLFTKKKPPVTQAMPEVLQLYYGEKKSEQDNEEGTPGTKGDEGAGDS